MTIDQRKERKNWNTWTILLSRCVHSFFSPDWTVKALMLLLINLRRLFASPGFIVADSNIIQDGLTCHLCFSPPSLEGCHKDYLQKHTHILAKAFKNSFQILVTEFDTPFFNSC